MIIAKTFHVNLIAMIISLIVAILIPTTSIAFLTPPKKPLHVTLSTVIITTATATDRIGTFVEPTEAQFLLWQRQIKLCGNNVTKGLQLLRQIKTTPNSNQNVAMDETNYHIYESLYLETLGVIGRAKRSNPKSMIVTTIPSNLSTDIIGNIIPESLDLIQQIAIQLYTECPTDACRARTISICNTASSHTPQQQENIQNIAIQLLHSGSQPPRLPSYHAALAACAIAKNYQYALHMLQREMPLVGQISTTTLSYNILFTALCRAGQGYVALDILKQMIPQQQQPPQKNPPPRNPCNAPDTLTHLPPPDLNTFHITIKALIATTSLSSTSNAIRNGTCGNHLDVAYSVLNIMTEFDHWYNQNHSTSTTETRSQAVRPNTVTFDLLIQAYSRMGAWEKVKFIETIQSQYSHFYSPPTRYDQKFVFPTLPTLDPTSNHEITATTNTATTCTTTKAPMDDLSTITPISFSSPSSSSPYFSSSIRLQWEQVGMKKFKNEKYWMIGTYSDPIQGYHFIVALQPHRNPIKNGIKILLYNNNNNNNTIGTTKVGYLLMINHPANAIQDLTNNNETSSAMSGTSTLLGVYLDPLYRQGGLSKVMIAIWLQLCHKAQAIPRTGIMNKPLLVLVLQHTFHFIPEVTSGNNGVNVEVSLVPNTTASATSMGVPSSSSAIGIYSSNIKCLQGVFSLRDIRRENIQLLREPSAPRRGRSCQIGATFVVSNVTTNANMMTEIVEQQLLGKSQSGQLVYNANDLSWGNVFFGYNEPQQ
jgi:pentatricopeptide repeat protein